MRSYWVMVGPKCTDWSLIRREDTQKDTGERKQMTMEAEIPSVIQLQAKEHPGLLATVKS